VVRGNQQLANNRLADIGPSLEELATYNPLLGEGYGTRVTGFDEKYVNASILDDQWLKTLLEIGFLGVVAWLWLFTRVVKRLVRASRDDDSADSWLYTGLAASLLALAVSMLTFDMFSFIQVTFLLYILFGLSAAALGLRDRQAPQAG
jgi:O-antigen ligase